jgi:ferrochelatase
MENYRDDAILIYAYGGPESAAEVTPYLERLFGEKHVSPAWVRLGEERYAQIGGKSPMMGEMRRFAETLRAASELPVYLGCLYRAPFVEDALREIAAAGHRSVLVLIASPFGDDSVRLRYTERLRQAASLAPETEFRPVPSFSTHPKWLRAQSDLLLSQLAMAELDRLRWDVPDDEGETLVLFSAHSLPTAGNTSYAEEIRQGAEAVARTAGLEHLSWQQVYQSRSGSPSVPWLEPDIGRFATEAHAANPKLKNIVVLPFGFFFENLETVGDLDLNLAAVVTRLGLSLYRAPAAAQSPETVEMVLGFLSSALPTLVEGG